MKIKEPEHKKLSLEYGDKRLYSLIKVPVMASKAKTQHGSSLSAAELIKRVLEQLEEEKKKNKDKKEEKK